MQDLLQVTSDTVWRGGTDLRELRCLHLLAHSGFEPAVFVGTVRGLVLQGDKLHIFVGLVIIIV